MCAARLKIVARNVTAVPAEDCVRAGQRHDWPDPDTTELSDQHLSHIWRLNGLGEFNRAQWERQRSYVQWKILNNRLMDERDALNAEGAP